MSIMTHDDLNDDLGDLWGDLGRDKPTAEGIAAALASSEAPEPTFTEPCKKCRGRGQFVGYSGRVVGPCFTCKGTGTQAFKTSPEARAAKRDAVQKAKAEKIMAFFETHREEFNWISSNVLRNEFAKSMLDSLIKYGSLTDGKLAAVQKNIARDQLRAEAKIEAVVNAKTIDVSKIEVAFAKARSNDIQTPKMNLGAFRFSMAPDDGANAGAIYVKTTDGNRTYLGKVKDGKFIKGFKCSPEQEAAIIEVASDPLNSARAYGQATKKCCICGIKLTAAESREKLIGPICESKYFGG